jgi:hypothetical protein
MQVMCHYDNSSGEVGTSSVVLFNSFQGLVVWAPLETVMDRDLCLFSSLSVLLMLMRAYQFFP